MTFLEVLQLAGAVLVSLGGGGAIVFGLSSWLGKLWASRVLERDRAANARELEGMRSELAQHMARINAELEATNRRVQAELDRTIFVHRMQFETEFQALSRIWAAVAKLRGAMAGLRPIARIVDPNEDPRRELNQRLGGFLVALGELMAATHDHSPFYPPEIESELATMIQAAKLEEIQVRTTDETRDPKWYEKGEANFAKVIQSADRTALLIRQRISRLSIVGGERPQ